MNRTGDFFDGIFDNTATGQREVWVNGKPTRYCRKNAITPHAVWEEMRAPWGSYADAPGNVREVA